MERIVVDVGDRIAMTGVPDPGPANRNPIPEQPMDPARMGPVYPSQAPMPNPMMPPVRQPIAPPLVPWERRPNDMTRGFAIAGIVLAIIAAIFAMLPLWDDVSVFGVVGLALDVIAACSLFSDSNRTPVWIGTVVVAALLCVASIVIVAVT